MNLRTRLFADIARQLEFSRGVKPEKVGRLELLAVAASPRFAPVLLCRLSHWFAQKRLRPVAKALSMANFVFFGLEVAVDCEIGPGLYFPHTSGTVIGARRIGSNAIIYQNVTIGAKVPDLIYDPMLRPEIGDNVLVGAGAKVLGSLTVHDGAVVAANAVVVQSVPSNHLVAGVPGKAVPRKQPNHGPTDGESTA